MSELEVVEGERVQHPDDIVVRTVTFANVTSGTVANPTATVRDLNSDKDVTATVMPGGSHSVSSPVVTLKPLKLLVDRHLYRVEVKAADGTNTFVSIHFVKCVRK